MGKRGKGEGIMKKEMVAGHSRELGTDSGEIILSKTNENGNQKWNYNPGTECSSYMKI